MTATGLSRAAVADLNRVTQALEMLAPRWSVWTLMTLSEQPMRYTEIKPRLALLADSQLSVRLKRLTADGLVDRDALSARNVSYRLTDRGQALAPVLAALATWGDARLEKRTVPSRAIPGMWEQERIPAAQNAEDTLALITARHTTAVMWLLQAAGRASTAADLAERLPGPLTAGRLYPVLSQLVDDELAERSGSRGYRLTAHGRSLAPVYRALSAWAAGRPASTARKHPIWSAADEQRQDMLRPPSPRRPAPLTGMPVSAGPALSTAPGPGPKWRPGDLFSHSAPAPLAGVAAMGGRAR